MAETHKLMSLIQAANSLVDEGDGEAHVAIRACVSLNYRPGTAREYRQCGSIGLGRTPPTEEYPLGKRRENPALSFYRLFWLFGPCFPQGGGRWEPDDGVRRISFDDMFKMRVLDIFSADRRFCVEYGLYKYEPALVYFAPPELVYDPDDDRLGDLRVRCRVPGAKDARCTDPVGLAFFELITRALNTKWCVYGGNHFFV